MASVQIRNKQKIIDIMCGEEKLGEIKFNPDDTRTYSRFIELVEALTKGKQDIDGVQFDSEELKQEFGEQDLESIEDFKRVGAMLDKVKKVTDIAVEAWDSTCKGLDEIFGKGVCEIFTQGALDPELLTPMFQAVMPFFKESRQDKAKPYLKNV